MAAEVYYFSGTGNSLAVARDIAARLDGKLISIASVVDRDRILTDADVIGIVFPVYYVGLRHVPLIVERFTAKLDDIGGKYVFAVCTYGGGSGNTLRILDEILRGNGGKLAAGFGVQMPQNAFDKPFENKQKLFDAWKAKKLGEISEYIDARKSGRIDADTMLIKAVTVLLLPLMGISFFRPIFVKSMYKAAGCEGNMDIPFSDIIPRMDNSYRADENCTGCGTCAKVCPARNIVIAGGKPAWQHRCENCLACVNWCPKKSIHGYGELPNMKRYHHPEVKLSDMMSSGGRA